MKFKVNISYIIIITMNEQYASFIIDIKKYL